VSKITRYNGNLKAFASEATGTERTIFGDTAQSDTLDANITLDLLRGWGVIGVESNPTKQHFNGLAFTLGQLIAYLHQQGVPEWNAAQEYYAGSVVTTLAGIYRLKSGGVGSSDPDTDGGINWELIPTQAKVDDKADKATTYTETEVDGLLDEKADQANTYTETEVDELTGSLAYPNTTLASSSDISEDVQTAIAEYPHIQGFRTGTGTALTFAQVVEEAAERGARLLTIQELEAGVAVGTGFSYDGALTWTSSPAGVGLVYGNIGGGDGTRVVLNTNTDTAAGGYAVSVIGQRQWTDTQYADKATTYTETEVDSLLDDKAAIAGQVFTGDITYYGGGGVSSNTSYGSLALDSNTTGNDNTANGYRALYSNTEGIRNTAHGYYALAANTTGDGNTATGRTALRSNTTGSDNTANGYQALFSNTTGSDNTANGYQALFSNTTGSDNTACGHHSGGGIMIGSGNSIFGANVTGLAFDLTDNLILASGGVIRLQHDGVGITTVQGDLVADNLSGTNTGDQTKADIDALNIDADTLDGLDSLDFVRDNGDSGMSGDYSTTGHVESGRGSGGVALTVNDGQGNANVTFNHANGEAEQAGNSGRITLNTDSMTSASMVFEVVDNDVSGSVNTIRIMSITENGVEVNQGNISAPNLSGTNTGDQTLSEIGVGQTWQDVSGSRSVGVTYTNTTGKPINLFLVIKDDGVNGVTFSIDGISLTYGNLTALQNESISLVIPNGVQYGNLQLNGNNIRHWLELR